MWTKRSSQLRREISRCKVRTVHFLFRGLCKLVDVIVGLYSREVGDVFKNILSSRTLRKLHELCEAFKSKLIPLCENGDPTSIQDFSMWVPNAT